MNGADTAFVLISAALVMFMTPGLALFYGGMVRSKNVLATIMQSFVLLGLASVVWVVLGYTLAFGTDQGGIIGSLEYLMLSGVGMEAGPFSETIPHLAFMIFQCMFAVITPALITGAFAERVRFAPFLVFSLLWSILVYNPVCHWVWGAGGFLKAAGVVDFAGGLVVHLTCGTAALASVLIVGPRKDYGRTQFFPHSLPLTLLGTGMLWFGWFGFNGGSALAADGVAATAFVATHLGGMAGMFMWTVLEWKHRGKPTTLGAASGAVAGLATITPGAGFVAPWAAIVIGLVAGAACYLGVLAKARLGYDDSLDVVGIHGLGGLIGTLLAGLFATKAVNAAGVDGLLYGNVSQLGVQAYGVVVVGAYALVVSWILLKAVNALMPLRMPLDAEAQGMDLVEHTETAYSD